MNTFNLKLSPFRRFISFAIAMIMVLSCGSIPIFAAEEIYGTWKIENDGTDYKATTTNIPFTYYSPGNAFKQLVLGDKKGLQSVGANGAAQNGIVTTSKKGYGEYKATQDGTLTVYVGKANNKIGYISKTAPDGTATAITSFTPSCDAKDSIDIDECKITQDTNWAIVDIEVQAGYTYYINVSGSKMVCYGADFVPYTAVTGSIDNSFGFTDYGIKFTNQENERVKEAIVDTTNNTYSVMLKPGFSYSASLTGSNAIDYAITGDTRVVTVSGENMTANLGIEKAVTYKVSGSLNGFDTGYNLSDLTLKFVPKDTNSFATITVDVDKDNLTYSAQLTANVEYTLTQDGAFDYEISKAIVINKADDTALTQNVDFAKVSVYDVSGKFIGLTQERGVYKNLTPNISGITFKNVKDNYTYNLTATSNGFSGKLRNGSYIASITCEGYSTTTHIVVDGKSAEKDILLKDENPAKVNYTDTLYVGKDKDYKTVQSAVEAVSLMDRPNSEAVTIKIDPGLYREQVHVTAPNITLESNGGNRENTTITWYYGIGYKYYSSVNSYYNPYADYDKFEKGDVVNYWGSAVIVDANATGFNAKGIKFENSFNKYMTEEELTDGVELNGREGITVVRKENTNVDTKTATERAAALVNYADKTEFFECSFIGSQDTLYTCNKSFMAYYKNCYIEGQTDFIYGDGDVLFDGCEINWCGYDGTGSAGYLTAQSSNPSRTAGYVFRNCIITGNKERTVVAGYFGRMWGKGATVNFINTQVENPDYLIGEGWGAMSGTNPTDSTVNLKEYNTTYNGTKVDTSKRVAGNVDSINLDDYSVETVFIANGWTPKYYTASSDVAEIEGNVQFTSNGDLNTPNPGETVRANFELNGNNNSSNASRISWYAVDTDFDGTSLDTILQKSTLLYTTTAYVSKSFKIPMDCEGKYLMAVVTPIVIGGKAEGTPKYVIAKEKPISGVWADPDNVGDIAPGSGINIYLAGDSTVKDYSEKGIYNGGKIRNEGSWGEFLQYYFDEKYVTINDYAEGGRSSRSFINEGKLDIIKSKIKKGDYLFIQFGHNDCANGAAYYNERFAPLYAKPNGADVVDGVYPTILPTEDLKVATPSSYTSSYGDKYYSWDCGATYKGYLQAYINVALEVGATPVIVSPVSRLYYTDDGKIKAHHDANMTDYDGTKEFLTSNDAYVTACKQLVEENKANGNNVIYLDAFNITKSLYEKAYADSSSKTNGQNIMAKGETTHSNKVGGVIQAGLIAQWLQNANLSVSEYVQAPTKVYGENADGNYIFTIKDKKITASDNEYNFSEYWTNYAQELINAIDKASQGVEYAFGDADGDGKVTENDAKEILKKAIFDDYILSIQANNRKYRSVVDVDGDGKITATDSVIVTMKAKDSNYQMPVEK